MAAQPFVSALSICGPAFKDSINNTNNGVFGSGVDHTNLPQRNIAVSRPEPKTLSSKENTISSKSAPVQNSKTPARQPAIPKTPTKPTAAISQKPPFLVGKAPIRNQKQIVANGDNRLEIAGLKRQISELTSLLRQEVQKKIEKCDVGTDPIIFDDSTKEKDCTRLCSNCKNVLTPPPTLYLSPRIDHESEDDSVSLCSQLESLAMQYLSDDQLANIAYNRNRGERQSLKNNGLNKKEEDLEFLATRYLSDDPFLDTANGDNQIMARTKKDNAPCNYGRSHFRRVEKSPPKRRLAAITTTTQSSVFSPDFSDGGLMLTRRQCVMTMEQQVSVFGNGSSTAGTDSLPFGVSVASQDFLQRHGILRATGGSDRRMRHLDYNEGRRENQYDNRPRYRRDN